MVWHKYIASFSVSDWIRVTARQGAEISVVWKAVLKSLDVIRHGLAWKVGNGRRVRIGIGPWIGSDLNHIHP